MVWDQIKLGITVLGRNKNHLRFLRLSWWLAEVD